MIDWAKLKKKIPSKVHLRRGVYYEIVWMSKDENRKTVGETRYDTRQIAIQLEQSDKEAVHTYLHEIAHAISGEYDIGLTESQVIKFEQAVYYLLKENNIFKGLK